MRLTYADIKNEVGLPISMCGDHASLLPMVNEACQILWNETDWPGKNVRYRISVTGDCNGNRVITWPRGIETIEAAAVSGNLTNYGKQTVGIRDQWFEFLDNGTGILDNYGCGNLLADLGESCTFEDITGVNKKIKVYADKAEDTDSTILLLGYDENNNWIRTQDITNAWIDGEVVSINDATPTVSVNFFSKLTGVQKPATNGSVRLYALDTDSLIEHPLAIYEYDETVPVYRRSRLTGLFRSECRCLTVTGKRRFIPIKRDTDFVFPPYLPAIKTAVMGLFKRDNAAWQEYTFAMQQAKYLLQKMNQHYRGNGAARRIVFANGETWGAGTNVK